MEYFDNKTIKTKPLYRGLTIGAGVTAVFAVIMAVFLLFNNYHIEKDFPENAKQLKKLQRQYKANPDNNAVVEQLRSLDAKVKHDELRRQRFGQTGSVFFTIGIIISAMCLLTARMLLHPEPKIPDQPICSGEFIQKAMQTRIALSIACAVIFAVGVFFLLYGA